MMTQFRRDGGRYDRPEEDVDDRGVVCDDGSEARHQDLCRFGSFPKFLPRPLRARASAIGSNVAVEHSILYIHFVISQLLLLVHSNF